MLQRPRRNRQSNAIRSLVQETTLRPSNLVWPVFIQEGTSVRKPISSMPGVSRFSPDQLLREAEAALKLGIPALALFPALEDSLKSPDGAESWNRDGLLPRMVRLLKSALPELLLFTDVALDPYSSDGHDGLVENGQILNDETLPLLAQMALTQAEAGADFVAPSDMMDGRVGYLRSALDTAGFTNTGICSYCAKYASAFYGPFREALDSAPKSGDKKSYQMDPHNRREALREIALDEAEGADILLIKPGMPYLDIVSLAREHSNLPVAVYQVSGEYAMLKAAGMNGWIDYRRCMTEALISFRRAGADMIFTYAAPEVAAWLG